MPDGVAAESTMILCRPFLRRLGARLALLALWLQFGLSFGHLDPDDIFPYGRFVAFGYGVQEMVAPHQTDPFAPIPGDPNLSADIDCPICASMTMMAATVPAEGPLLLPLSRWDGAPASRDAPIVLTARRHLSFQTRAPPLA